MTLASLTIRMTSRGEYHLTLVRPGALFADEGIFRLAEQHRETLRKYILDAALGSEAGAPRQDSLEVLGQLLYGLLPPGIGDALSQLTSPLVIRAADPTMPWELLHDGSHFLGIRCFASRALPDLLPPEEPMPPPERVAALIIANPTGELEEADKEAGELHQFLQGLGALVHVLRKRQANSWEFLGRLKSGQYNLIHYTGHAGCAGAEEESYLELSDGHFPASMIVTSLAGSPLVFINGCRSAHQPPERSLVLEYDATVSSLPVAFLSRGARGFVGTSWPVPDQSARLFSRFFYEALLADECTLGEAMARARKCSRETMEDDAAWAAYISYGHPQNRLLVIGEVPAGQPQPPRPAIESVIDEERGINTRRLEKGALLALFYAWDERRRMGQTYLETAHLIIGLTKVSGGYTQEALHRLGVDPRSVRNGLRRYFAAEQVTGERMSGAAKLTTTQRLGRILRLAETVAEEEGSSMVEEKHLLVAFVREGGGQTARILGERFGIDLDDLVREAPPSLVQLGRTEMVTEQGVWNPFDEEGRLRIELLDGAAQQLCQRALVEARYWHHALICVAHLLLASTESTTGFEGALWHSGLVDLRKTRTAMRRRLGEQEVAPDIELELNRCRLSPGFQRLLELAWRACTAEDAPAATVRHLFRACGQLETSQMASVPGKLHEFLRRIANLLLPHPLFASDGFLAEDRLDDRGRRALAQAQQAAEEAGLVLVTSPQLVSGLLAFPDGQVQALLRDTGVKDPQGLAQEMRQRFGRHDPARETECPPWQFRFSAHCLNILRLAATEAEREGAARVSDRHLLMGVVRDGQGVAVRFLVEKGVRLAGVRASLWGSEWNGGIK